MPLTPLNRRDALRLAAAAATCALPGLAFAAYPDRVVKVVVPFAAGGATDIIGRIVAQQLGTSLGQQFIVENKGGAGGNLGAEAVAKGTPDGYTLLMGAMTSHATIATLEKGKVRYDLIKDFSTVAVVGRVPLVFVVHPSLPVKSMKELVAYIRSHPGKVSFGSSGAGAPQRMAAEMLKLQNKLQTENIPYRGSGPAVSDLIAGQLHFMAETIPAVLQHIRAGKLRALAVAGSRRDPSLPDVPTTAEAGMPDLEVSSTFGLLAPASVPKDVIQRLNAEVYKSLQKADVQALLAQQGVQVQSPITPEAAHEQLKAEVAKWAKLIAEASIKADE
ncbi:tripartite tricarboxylate transporter substrate binding protein [Ideonella sp. DXS22W]|uniref:Tripartite tricarboxylate transporter substrate binding protein n=1 Tax=Pseudaquabacterium inlustre TaxID=2984192 RepID=A0ABU9CMD8_9BURK